MRNLGNDIQAERHDGKVTLKFSELSRNQMIKSTGIEPIGYISEKTAMRYRRADGLKAGEFYSQ